MFTLDSIQDFQEESKTVTVGDETYKIRRLDGIDRLRVGDMKTTEDVYLFILANGLLDGKTEKQVGEQIAYRLVRGNYAAADKLVAEISNYSRELDAAIADAVEDEKKNLEDSEASNFTAGDIASDTDSIPEQST